MRDPAKRRQAEAIVRDIRIRQLEGSKKPAAVVNRFLRVILASLPAPIDRGELEHAAIVLRTQAGRRSLLGGQLRYGFAAMILARGLRPDDVVGRMKHVRVAFRRWKIARAGSREALAALFLVLRAGGRPVSSVTLDRMRDLLASWRRKHWLVTGPDDYPMAALHASRDEEIEALEARIEDIYRLLAAAGFRRGNQLQLASHLLAVAPWPPAEASARFCCLAKAFRARKQPLGLGQYDELAILSLAAGEPKEIAQAVVIAKGVAMRTDHLSGAPAFSVAVGEFLAQQARERVDVRDADDFEMLAAARKAVRRTHLEATAKAVGVAALLFLGVTYGVPDAIAPVAMAFIHKDEKKKTPWQPRATRRLPSRTTLPRRAPPP